MLMRLGLASYFVLCGKYRDVESILTDRIERFPNNPMASRLTFHRAMARLTPGPLDYAVFRATLTRGNSKGQAINRGVKIFYNKIYSISE